MTSSITRAFRRRLNRLSPQAQRKLPKLTDFGTQIPITPVSNSSKSARVSLYLLFALEWAIGRWVYEKEIIFFGFG